MGLIMPNTHYGAFDWCGTGTRLNASQIINAGMNTMNRPAVN